MVRNGLLCIHKISQLIQPDSNQLNAQFTGIDFTIAFVIFLLGNMIIGGMTFPSAQNVPVTVICSV